VTTVGETWDLMVAVVTEVFWCGVILLTVFYGGDGFQSLQEFPQYRTVGTYVGGTCRVG